MNESQFIEGFFDFLSASPTPFHATTEMADRLKHAGFKPLLETERWHLEPGQRYYITRNDSSLIAIVPGRGETPGDGIRMAGAHTDSPGLKVKPRPERVHHSYLQLGVEVDGGALLWPWFDRDLSLAGRVSYLTQDQVLKTGLIDYRRPVTVIPSLAIHLDREVNKGRAIDQQKELPPLLAQIKGATDFRQELLKQLLHQYPEGDADSVLDYEIFLYDTQKPALVGLNREFIAGPRLDNLLSCYIGLVSLLEADAEMPCLLVCNDHEEVGSVSTTGAQGPFLKSVLRRWLRDPELYERTLAGSMMISMDNAHGVHPNYTDKFDPRHGPVLNQGPVIKTNANQRYASSSETAAVFRHLCQQADVPVQDFVVRSDMACGSTIGPLTAGAIGVRTLDVGVPTFAMHSIRETAGTRDGFYLYRAMRDFFRMVQPPLGGM